jgi:ribosomal protein S18 acetylase RimI-like enzyme
MVERVAAATPEVVAALGRLIPQLDDLPSPTAEQVAAVVAGPGNILFVLRDPAGEIRATLTLVLHRKLLGNVAWIEDVVVDEGSRGRGYGRLMVEAAEEAARAAGLTSLRLTSRESRTVAHGMYEKLGYRRHQTRVYRKDLG